MDYEEKYKDLVKAVKELQEANPSDEGIQNWVNENVPELVEDERIRKELIDFVKSRAEKYPNDPKYKNISAWIAWLEKQCEQKSADTDDKFIRMRETKPKDISEFLDRLTTVEQEFLWEHIAKIRDLDKEEQKPHSEVLEKQGNKPQGKTALEAIHEQKADNANKVEPPSFDEAQGTPAIKKCREHKFEKGNWIVGHKVVCRILAIYTGGYIVDIDNCELFIPFEDEELYHPWTIADAKDGDVLYLQHEGKEHIIIYKGVIKERFRTFVSAYCAYNGIVDAFCFADVSRYADIAYGGIMPANKEQCNILFAKMKEAGYEWDSEKKELKKIGTVDIPFSVKDSELIESTYFIPEGFHAEIEDNKVIIKKGEQKPTIEMITPEKSLGIDSDTYNEIVDECIYGEQKPAWSEEDEMSKIKSCLDGQVGDTIMFDNSGYSSTITRVERQVGGVMYHLQDGGSISTLEGGWKYFTIIEM